MNVRQQFDPMATSPAPPRNDVQSHLQAQGFPTGMIHALLSMKERYPLRVWILDNSQRMQIRDAHVLTSDYTDLQRVHSRWEELRETVLYHCDRLATRLDWPTRFALLNAPRNGDPQHLGLNQRRQRQQQQQQQTVQQEWQLLQRTLHQIQQPEGPADVLTQLRLLREYIVSIAPQLQASQHTIPIIICTQGLLTDRHGQSSPALGEELVQMLQSFRTFPVSFVLRLCTDDEQAFEFYNALDARIALPLDVLDDYYGEALEVYLRNPWLCYTTVLHRFRELGASHIQVLDALDERALTLTELRDFVQFLWGVSAVPDPRQNWTPFVHAVQRCLDRERPHWNPVLKRVTPWINVSLLNSIYGSAAPSPSRSVPAYPSSTEARRQDFSHQPPPPQPHQASSTAFQGVFPPQPGSSQNAPPPQPRRTFPSAPPQPSSSPAAATAPSHTTPTTTPTTVSELTRVLQQSWSKRPPQYTQTKPIAELLATIQSTFALVPRPHAYFDRFHPFARDALYYTNDNTAVLKKAVRKVRLFLHPDKLPADLTELQRGLCRQLWDTVSEAWDAHQSQ